VKPRSPIDSVVATTKGDDGTTGLLFGGSRIAKDDPRTEAYGTIDETVAALGLARAHLGPGGATRTPPAALADLGPGAATRTPPAALADLGPGGATRTPAPALAHPGPGAATRTPPAALAHPGPGAATRTPAPGLADLGDLILRFQRELFVAGAELATNPEAWDRLQDGKTRVSRAMVEEVERVLIETEHSITMPTEFVVPGETLASAALEVARTTLRRAERRAVTLGRDGLVPGEHLIPYLNRLADLLWVLARAAEQAESRAATPARHEQRSVARPENAGTSGKPGGRT